MPRLPLMTEKSCPSNMKQTLYCYDCNFFEIHFGFECPKCGSINIDIDKEVDREDYDNDATEQYLESMNDSEHTRS